MDPQLADSVDGQSRLRRRKAQAGKHRCPRRPTVVSVGLAQARAVDSKIHPEDQLTSFSDSFKEALDSIPTPLSECISTLLASIALDPGFRGFLSYAQSVSLPVIILSGGMEPIIRALLTKLVSEHEAASIKILSSHVRAREGKDLYLDAHGWEIVFHDDSPYGHDKSLAIKEFSALPEAERPVLFYAGDGLSDLSAARETDLLFAKKGRGKPAPICCGSTCS
jgi:2,3-diketo-5-methylthio-1-phosphopentane phosphatase